LDLQVIFYKKKEVKVVELPVIPVVEPPKDRDGDGVLDALMINAQM
jgi:hypothetical protein